MDSFLQAGEKGEKKAMDTAKLLELLNTFLTFTLAMYPDRIDYVEAILKGAVNVRAGLLGQVVAPPPLGVTWPFSPFPFEQQPPN